MDEITVWDAEENVFEWGLATFKNPSHAKGQTPTRYVAENTAGVMYILSKLNNYALEEVNLYPNQYIRPCFDRDSEGIPIDYEKDMEMIREILGDVEIKIESREPRDKHNNGKMFYSARYVVQERRIRRNQLSDLIRWNKNVPEKYFDVSVYGDGGQFFTVFNNKKFAPKGSTLKYIDVPPLLPVNDEDVNVLDYCITYVLEEWADYDAVWGREWEKKELEKEKKVKVVYKEEDCDMIELELIEIIKRLSAKRADDYCDWRGVCFALINCGIKCNLKKRNIESLIHDFSSKCDDKYEDDLVEKWFETTYYNLANSKAQKKLGRNYLINTCLKQDDYEYWKEKYQYRTYDVVLAELNKECVKIRMNGMWVIFREVDRNNAERYNLYDKKGLQHYYESEEQFKYVWKKEGKDGKMITENTSIVNSGVYYNDTNMKCYDNIVYTPCFDGVMDGKYLNTWDGWDVMKYPKCNDYSKCQVFLTHLKEVWCDGCEASYKWFLEYLSVIVRGGRTCVGVILRGGQGCGKDCFMTDLLMNRVLGQKYCMMTNDPVNQLFGKFNSSLLNKSLVVIAEGGYDLDKCYSNIKDLITNGVLRIEKKFADITPNVNYANFMISTNAYDIIKDGKGRRLGYWSCSDKYKGNKKYFDGFYEAVNDDDAVSAFYNLLIDSRMVYQADIEDLAYLQSTMPQTKTSKDIAVKNTPIVSQFLNGYFKMSKLEEYVKLNKVVKVKRGELYSAYRRFCDKCGYERLKLNLFSAQLLNLHNVECKKSCDYWFVFTLDILMRIKKDLEDLEKEGKEFKLDDAIIHHNPADFEEDD